jgi:hypothetical protein
MRAAVAESSAVAAQEENSGAVDAPLEAEFPVDWVAAAPEEATNHP